MRLSEADFMVHAAKTVGKSMRNGSVAWSMSYPELILADRRKKSDYKRSSSSTTRARNSAMLMLFGYKKWSKRARARL